MGKSISVSVLVSLSLTLFILVFGLRRIPQGLINFSYILFSNI